MFPDQKKMVIAGSLLVIIVKLLELPSQENISLQMLVTVILVAGFIVLIYSGKSTPLNILAYFIISPLVNIMLLSGSYSHFNGSHDQNCTAHHFTSGTVYLYI